MMKIGKWSPERLAGWTGGTWTAMPELGIDGVTQDTRSLSRGDLYVALRGAHFDGHDFVAQAFEAGAAAALVDEEWAHQNPTTFPCLVVNHTQDALVQLAVNHRRAWSARVVGITGSVGKTTVKELLADMLSSQGTVSRTRGNYNNTIGVPLSMLAASGDEAFGVFEVAMNQPGEISRLTELVRPSVGIVTPVGSGHVGQFENEEGVAHEKAALVERVDRKGFCVLSADLPWFDVLSSKSAARVVTVALNGPANWTGQWTADGFEIFLEGNSVLTCTLPVRAEFMARNALLATAAACRLGVGVEDIKRAIEHFKAPGMRWRQSTVNGVDWINDSYNANPLSMRAALAALDQLTVEGERWAVLGGMHELGAQEVSAHRDLGRVLKDVTCRCITVGPLAAGIADGAALAGVDVDRVIRAQTQADAVALLQDRVRPGDTVLLKASRAEKLETILEEWTRISRD